MKKLVILLSIYLFVYLFVCFCLNQIPFGLQIHIYHLQENSYNFSYAYVFLN